MNTHATWKLATKSPIQAGVAHRDIKPENCLISSAGVLKVADFGLSRLHRGRGDILDQSEMSTDSVGTLSYAAPEVLNGRYNAFRADLWSVGVVIFVACTGKFPFGSRGYTEAMVQEDIKNARVNKMPSHLTEEVRNLIMSLIVVDPEKRLTLAEMLKHPWLVPAVRPAEADGEDGSHTARKRPVPIDINAVTSKASEQVTDAVSDTMSPTWANSPMGNHPQKFVPPMFSPRSSSPRTSEALPKKPSTSVNSLVALKGMLEEEGKKLSQRSC
ncbi:CBL-interacting protein kinase 16 [Diplonema papillatum]|nr:CBL-interacting protein kinase 16 [Diplonema papillatum]